MCGRGGGVWWEPQDATGGEDLKDEKNEEAREGEERARNTEHGADGEGNRRNKGW